MYHYAFTLCYLNMRGAHMLHDIELSLRHLTRCHTFTDMQHARSVSFLPSQTVICMISYSISYIFFHTRTNVRFIHITRYNIVFLAFTYGIPMVVMIICYSVMGRELWGSKSIGENTERQTESVKSKKKVSKEHLLCQYDTHVQWFFVIFFVCLCPAPSHWFFAQCHLTLVIYYIRSSSRGSTFKCDVMKRMNNNLVAKMTNIAS